MQWDDFSEKPKNISNKWATLIYIFKHTLKLTKYMKKKKRSDYSYMQTSGMSVILNILLSECIVFHQKCNVQFL